MWNAKNYSSLKECFMKLNFSHNYLDFDKVKIIAVGTTIRSKLITSDSVTAMV
jgi:hypothetical protein